MQPNTDLEVTDKYTGEVAFRTALATTDVIEEGIADGSIACECPREAAEAVSLLANLWLLPLFRPLEPKERMLARAQCLAQMAAAVGLDLGNEVLQTTAQIWDVWNRVGW